MRQTIALIVDAYRELNSQKLFWITLVLSALVASTFAMIGIDEQGITFLTWRVPAQFNSSQLAPEVLYKSLFVGLGIGVWLTWAATILGLIATAGIFPNFITGGSIDLVLSRPIGRVRLFLTKYVAGLLFVTLQVTAFTAACFAVIGLRGGVWEPGLFLAVPIVICFFSYLFSVCVLLGLLTRSTIASLLLTMLFWLALFATNAADGLILQARASAEQRVQMVERVIARQAPDSDKSVLEQRLAEGRQSLAWWEKAERITMLVRTFAPKTSDTLNLLERSLISAADLPGPPESPEPDFTATSMSRFRPDPRAAARQVQEELRRRSLGWVLGTSLAFETLVLVAGAWIFQRRDFSS